MNSVCTICSEIFAFPSAEVYVTSCGHVFDFACLLQWLERSKTCPQCRYKCTEKSIRRVYFTFANNEGLEDAACLQNKLDNFALVLSEKEKKVKKLHDKTKELENVNKCLRKELCDVSDREKTVNSLRISLQEQVTHFKSKIKLVSQLNKQVEVLNAKVQRLESQETVIHGSEDEVNDMMRNQKDSQALCFLVVTLKKTLMDTDRKRKSLEDSLRTAEHRVSKYRKETSELSEQYLKLKQDVECHKYCETERQYLKRKIKQLQKQVDQSGTDICDTSVQRILAESPAPAKRARFAELAKTSFDKCSSPSVGERVDTIKESDSPYLNLKSNGLGVLHTGFGELATSSLFKQALMGLKEAKRTGDAVYDGLGGHSKVDVFKPVKRSPGVIKKHKSITRVPSDKFRKLAPQTKKIKHFLPPNPN